MKERICGAEMINIVRINDATQIIDLLFNQKYNDNIDRHRSSFLYRGLTNSTYKLETSLQRNCKTKQFDIEIPILRNFTKYASIEQPNLKNSVWSQLIIGQHHGLPGLARRYRAGLLPLWRRGQPDPVLSFLSGYSGSPVRGPLLAGSAPAGVVPCRIF